MIFNPLKGKYTWLLNQSNWYFHTAIEIQLSFNSLELPAWWKIAERKKLSQTKLKDRCPVLIWRRICRRKLPADMTRYHWTSQMSGKSSASHERKLLSLLANLVCFSLEVFIIRKCNMWFAPPARRRRMHVATILDVPPCSAFVRSFVPASEEISSTFSITFDKHWLCGRHERSFNSPQLSKEPAFQIDWKEKSLHISKGIFPKTLELDLALCIGWFKLLFYPTLDYKSTFLFINFEKSGWLIILRIDMMPLEIFSMCLLCLR